MDGERCAGAPSGWEPDGSAGPVELAVGAQPTPAMYRAIAETAVNPFAIVDEDRVVRWVSRSIEDLLGWRPDELVGKTMDSIVSPGSLADALEAFVDLSDLPPHTPNPRVGVGQSADLICRDGSTTPCTIVAATRSQTGLPYHLVFARRSGYEKALDNALEAIAHHAELGTVLDHLVVSLKQSVPTCRVAIGHGWQGTRFAVAAGDAVDLLVDDAGTPWARALASGDDVFARAADGLPPALARSAAARGLACCWVHPVTLAGDRRPDAALVMWRPHDGVPTRLTWSTVHRTGRLLQFTLQWDRSHRALEFAATHDTLTGLANRPAFVTRLVEIAGLAGGEAAVLFIDLDDFKPVNDEVGHLAGDHVLRVVADRLGRTLRPGDLVARFGGDEFAVLCERLGDADAAGVVADRLLAALGDPIALDDGREVKITGSVGVTDIRPGEGPEAVLARADTAMRAAKADGRNRWVAAPAARP